MKEHQEKTARPKEDFCITENYTLKEAADAIRRNNHRGVIVLNDADKVCGFVSQGDIIKAIEDEISLYARVQTILRPSFLYTRERDLQAAFPLFKERRITILPVVDEEFRLIDVITLQDIFDHMIFAEDGQGA